MNLAIDIIKVVRSIVEDFGDYEGTFPSRSEFVWFLLIHSEDQVSFLEGSTLHIFWHGIDASLADRWSI